MAKQADHKIMDITEHYKMFLLEECDLNPRFKFRLWYRAQVEAGQIWQIYRDGVQYDQLPAGPHVLWNSLWHRWKAQRINLRIVHLEFTFEGRVRGPSMPREAQSAAGVDLGCTVVATLELSCKISNIQKFLQYEEPLSVFLASLKNMIVEMIGKLPYDQFGDWATTLRDGVKNRLQGGRNDMVDLIGMKVEEVYVTEIQPNTLQDRNMVAMYQQVERVHRELVEAQANRQRDTEAARSFADQGSILGIAPSLLALQNSPIGKELLERDADLRKMMVAAGLNPGVSVQPLRDPQAQIGATPQSTMGYLNPPQQPAGNTGMRNFMPGPGAISGSLSPLRDQTGPIRPNPSLPVDDLSVDLARQDQELSALQAAGFECPSRGQLTPTFDSYGQPLPGTEEWTLEVFVRRINGYITVVFSCPASYPAVPPRVQVRMPTANALSPITPNVVRTWSATTMLVEIVREIDDNTP